MLVNLLAATAAVPIDDNFDPASLLVPEKLAVRPPPPPLAPAAAVVGVGLAGRATLPLTEFTLLFSGVTWFLGIIQT